MAWAQVRASVLTNIMERFLESLIDPAGRVFPRARPARSPHLQPPKARGRGRAWASTGGRTIGIQQIRGNLEKEAANRAASRRGLE
jgi:hypothetical protein